VIGQIKIFGPIGKYEENGKLSGVSLLDVISQVKELPQDTQVIEVHIASPGGYVEDGDNIYNYLESLKKQYVVNTIQDGNIASIATKLFLVGSQRTADQKFDFMIHNPWVDPGPGDSNHQADVLEGLIAEEDKLRKFYSKTLNITEEGLKPLMDQETTLTAQQLISLGFATTLKANKPVMAMKKDGEKGFDWSAKLKTLQKSIKALTGAQALDLQLMPGQPGSVLTVDAPNEDSLIGANATLDGNPAPDGDYIAMPDEMDGSSPTGDTITVKGGVVTAVTEPAGADPNAQAIEARTSNLEKNVAVLIDSVNALLEANKAQKAEAVSEAVAESEKKAEARIMALKNEIGTIHQPKKSSIVYAKTVDTEETPLVRPIAVRLKEIEERKRKNK
jgi:ATP-dependent protease ClpP protease subunit